MDPLVRARRDVDLDTHKLLRWGGGMHRTQFADFSHSLKAASGYEAGADRHVLVRLDANCRLLARCGRGPLVCAGR
jgi:hypothetical protein